MAHRAGWAFAIGLAACKPDAPPPPPPAVPHDAAPVAVADAAPPAIDAAAFALFDHMPVRTVTRAKTPRAAALPAGELRAVTLAVTREAPTEPARGTPREVARPAWMQAKLGTVDVGRYQLEPDGSSLAMADQTILLIDRAHHAELGLDVGELRGKMSVQDNPELLEGGDHVMTARSLRIEAVHRAGALVVIATPGVRARERDVLIGIDAATAEIVWVSRSDVAFADFAIAGGHAITSAKLGGGWQLVAIALDTGTIDASVPTHAGPYRLELVTEPGGALAIHGVLDTRADTTQTPIVLTATVALAAP